jgi:hypothetical protein
MRWKYYFPIEMQLWNHAHTEMFVLTLKRAVFAMESMKSVVVSLAGDGTKNVAVSAGR